MEELKKNKYTEAGQGKTFVYAGNWTVQEESSESGIGIYKYTEADGSLQYLETVRPDITPGIICADRKRNVLYMVDEQINSPAFAMQGGGGRVLAFSVNKEDGSLTQLGEEQPSFGTLPTYAAQDTTGSWLVVVNHGDKQAITKAVKGKDGKFHVVTDFSQVTVALYPLDRDGSILPACDLLKFEPDRSVTPVKNACLHAVYFAPDGEHFIITNMKQDRVLMLRIDRNRRELAICDTLRCPEGSWPRYGAFHPEKKLFYMNNEHALTVNTIRYDEKGCLSMVQTLNAAPRLDCVKEGKRISQSDIKISADGKFVYDFYRYTDALTVFAVNEESGLLTMIQSLELKEKRPRGFAISSDGRFLLVANLTGSITRLAVAVDGTVGKEEVVDRNMKHPGNILFYSMEN